MRIRIQLLIALFGLLTGVESHAQLAGCAAGCDSLVYDSKFNTQSDGWKVEPMTPIVAPCAPGNGDRWEWGTPTRVSSTVCDGTYSPPPIIAGQTKFWITELNGCFCNSSAGQDSMYIYKVIDLSTVTAPIRIEMVNWTDGCGPDRLAVNVNNTRVWDNRTGFPQPDNAATFYNTIITHPVLDAAAGTKNAVFTIIFFMSSVCNREGGVIANFDIRACKASCSPGGGGPTVPTLSEWGLLFLLLFFLSIGLIYRRRRRQSAFMV